MDTKTAYATLADECTADAVLRPELAQARVRAFKEQNKLSKLHQATQGEVGKDAEPIYCVDLDKFLEMVHSFIDDGYNGFRVYFACYPNKPLNQGEMDLVPRDMWGQLTLFFVPTRAVTGVYTGEDDKDQFYHLGNDGKINYMSNPDNTPANRNFVKRWINHYRIKRMHVLEQDGKAHTGNPNFLETRSHWYNIKTFAGDPETGDPGLLAFIDCRKADPDNPVKELYMQFAAFIRDEQKPEMFPEYQLTLIFYLRRANDPKPNKDNFIPLADALTIGSKSLREDSADTGVPCPPATYCPPSDPEP